MYTLAIPHYVFNGGDGHDMFEGQTTLVDAATGQLMVSALEAAVAGREIAPVVEGRITFVP